MSFTVEPTGRSASAARSQATSPVETSSTIAFGALTDAGQSRAARPPARASAAAAARTAAMRRGRAHWRSLIRWPGLSVCGSRSGFRRRISSSGTPVFSAIDDGVSPGLTL